MNETIRTMKIRRSVRNFTDEPVPRDLVEQVVDAGLWAPSGMGKQGAIVLAVTDRALRDRLSTMNADVMRAAGRGGADDFDPFYGGPVVLVVLADRTVPTSLYDASLVLGNMMNAAASLGLGSIWIHRAKEEFDSDEGKAILAELGVEGDYEGVGHCVLGYADKVTGEGPARKEGRVFWA